MANTSLASLLPLWMSIACLGAAPDLSAPQSPAIRNLTPQLWREDIPFLGDELPRKHLNAFHSISEKEWRQRIDDLARAVDRRSTDAILVRLMQALARISERPEGSCGKLTRGAPRLNPIDSRCKPGSGNSAGGRVRLRSRG